MAEPTPLASDADVIAVLGRDLTDSEELRVEALLRKASGLFRREALQLFTPGESDVRLKVNAGKVYLPQRPIVAIESVVDDDGNAVPWTRRQQWLTVKRGSHAFITVAYTHGAATVPDLVRITVAEVVMQVFELATSARQGVTKSDEAAGPFSRSETYAAWAVGGKASLSPDDKDIARSFRVKVPTAWVSPSASDSVDWLGPDLGLD